MSTDRNFLWIGIPNIFRLLSIPKKLHFREIRKCDSIRLLCPYVGSLSLFEYLEDLARKGTKNCQLGLDNFSKIIKNKWLWKRQVLIFFGKTLTYFNSDILVRPQNGSLFRYILLFLWNCIVDLQFIISAFSTPSATQLNFDSMFLLF